MSGPFAPWLARWGLRPDGPPIATHASRLLPVTRDGAPAMLKVALHDEERRGAAMLAWWRGEGAARVIAHDGPALLMERATGGRSLASMVRGGRDDEAARVVCAVAARLHARRGPPPPTAVPLERWFAALFAAAERGSGAAIERAAHEARALLAAPRDVAALHGDLHHDNVLDFGERRGWLAIDPKGLVGERAFDLANLFLNPDAATALAPGRLTRLADVVAAAAGVERERLLRWVVAYGGLSGAWAMEDGAEPGSAAAVAAEAARALDRGRAGGGPPEAPDR